jgi:3-carboxy-cis,cis-muconate cycloisomerase
MAPAETFFSTPSMAAVFSAESQVRHMLAFEAALARAEARVGVIPSAAADAIASACRVEDFDLDALFRDAVPPASLAIPLVKRLGELAGESRHVHWGATSQDAIDTGLVLQMREALDLLEADLLRLAEVCAALAERHRRTIMPGRTLLQQALPITFGLKAARWLGLVSRQVASLRALRPRVLVVQLGGAAGTLASLGDQGLAVASALADDLQLGLPDLPWHAERDRVADVAAALGVTAGAMAKIATDLVLLAQTEVAEVAEPAAPGKGGSSTLPQKRNPTYAVEAIAAARLAIGLVPVVLGGMDQEHERAAGPWQAEWSAVPDLFRWTAGAVERVCDALDGVEVFATRMRENLDQSQGLSLSESLSMALAPHIGRDQALSIVQELSQRAAVSGEHLRQVAVADPRVGSVLDAAVIDRALDPERYLGSTNAFIDRALAAWRATDRRLGSSDGEASPGSRR